MRCPDCYGTGHERPYEPWEDCATCDGTGDVDDWADDADEDPNEGIPYPFGPLNPAQEQALIHYSESERRVSQAEGDLVW